MSSSWFRRGTAALLAIAGAGMLVPGLYLAVLGGSPYYVAAGAAILLVAVLLWRGNRTAFPLFGALWLASLAWSLWETGLDGWALMPRMVFLSVAGLWLLLPALRRGTPPLPGGARRRWQLAFAGLAIGVTALGLRAVPQAGAAPAGFATPRATGEADAEWSHYGKNLGGTRFSPLAEITPANAHRLEQAWVFRSGMTIPGGTRKGGLQVTPLMVDGQLIGCAAFSSIFALDPVTGKQLWRHDPRIGNESGGHAVCRGVAFYRAPVQVADCPARLLLGTVGNRLIALDARTGKKCASFGEAGEVDLLKGLGDFPRRWTHPTSPPTIVGGTAVLGAYIADNQSANAPPGVVRGYDAVTGRLKWAFDPGRADAPGVPPPGGSYMPSTPNSWTLASGDEELGLVYVPMGNGSPDFFGGQRSAATERFSTALVALDAQTGAVRWRFQAVHHDLWDYDLAAQPVLIDFPVGGARVPALLLATKTGQIFVLDRRTGAPLTRVVERRVPASDVPGERAAPTQPFSVGMPDVAGAPLTEADMWGITPFDQLYCRIRYRQARYAGMYTPPRLGPTIRYPGELGGVDWGSVAVDPERQMLVVNSNHMADYDALVTREAARAEGLVAKTSPDTHSAPGGAMEGTPYAIHWGPFVTALGIPCQRPPFGFLTAIDLQNRRIAWRRPLGDARNSGPFGVSLGLPLPLGAPNIGGAAVTGGGLIFIAATQDEMFRAIDSNTGKTVWQTRLPAGGHATPMTYRGRDGHQYVVIAAGGRSLRDKPGDYFVAFRLKN